MLLRRFTQADAGPLAALYGDPRVMRFITVRPPSLAEVESEILPAYLREYRELADGLGSFAAIARETGRMAGRFSLKPANSYGLAGGTELGYRLYPPFWGRGLATEGARALIGSAFEHLPCDRVVATTMADSAHARAASMMTSGSTLLPLSTGTSSVVTLANRDASRCVNSGERAALHTDSTP